MAYKRLVPPRGWAVDNQCYGFGYNGDSSAFKNGWMKWELPSGLKEIYILAKLQQDNAKYLPVAYTDSDTSMSWMINNDNSNLKLDDKTIIALNDTIRMDDPVVVYEHFKSDGTSGLVEVKIPADNINATYSGNVLGGNDITQIYFGFPPNSDFKAWMYWMIISDEPIALTEQVALVTPKIAANGWTAGTDGSYTTSTSGATLTLTAPDDTSGTTAKAMQAYAADATGGTLTTLKIGEKSNTLTSTAANYYGDVTTDKSITITAE
jgi:hypothetical protein